MPDVFTIYNCGTSHNRQNLDETIADLARRTAGVENRDWMINDGPGSYSKRPHNSSAQERGLAAQAKTPGGLLNVPRGIISGKGWEANVAHTMAVLDATIDLPNVINMAGWSRGAITCFMIAHALCENPRTRSIEVNIFAFDPVPGPGNFDDPDKVTLPPNVKCYSAVVQEDDRRKIFRPILIGPQEAAGAKSKFYYMPGSHATGVFRRQNEVGLIGAFLAQKFLLKHGTRLSGAIQLTSRDLCELYAKIRIDIDDYRGQTGGFLKVLGLHTRLVSNTFKDTGYFINEHHAHQFRKTFPQMWQAMDRGVRPGENATFKQVVQLVRDQAPTTYISLEKCGIVAA
jgi:hypothetical protein